MDKLVIAIGSDNIGSETVQTVNARDLHSFLGVGKDFSSWMKVQIERARLVENRDFVKLTQKGERQILVEYHLTIDAGKQIGMMSGTDKGFEIRDYFLACERKAHNIHEIADPQTRALVKLLSDQDALRQEQSRQALMIEDVSNRLDSMTPRMTAAAITRLLGRISHVAKIYRNAQATKHIKLNVGESTGYFHSMILDKFDVADINYLSDVNQAIRMLQAEEKKYQAIIDDHEESYGLFKKP
jgi:phage anti-repressor protein